MAVTISGWELLSPFGSGRADFAAGLRGGIRPVSKLDPAQWPVPDPYAALVPGFDLRTAVGAKGVRNMDRLTGLAVATAGQFLGGPAVPGAPPRLAGIDDSTALVLGTDSGSVASMMDFTRASLVNSRPYLVEAARFPNVTMNCAAAQVAIWHTLRGPNTTVAGGRVTGLLALQYALRLHRAGRADAVVCGAVEEYSTARAWLAHHTGVPGPLAEGCALLLIEQDDRARAYGRVPLATVDALGFRVTDEAGVPEMLADLVRETLADAGVSPSAVWAAVTCGGPPSEKDNAAEMLPAALRWDTSDLLGDTGAASASFAIAGLLDRARDEPQTGARHAVVTAVDRDGGIGCAVLRLAAVTQ
jgi:3-oxoacyl-[acyl-carrier-protein] synthase II